MYQHHNHKSSADGDYEFNKISSTRPSQPFLSTYPSSLSPPHIIPFTENPSQRDEVTTKVNGYDGVPNDSSHPNMIIQDPRTCTINNEYMSIDLPDSAFTPDKDYYIGQCPGVDVTLSNLNDNIDKKILNDLVIQFGKINLVQIFYHPVSRKHLGLAKIVFENAASAKCCVQKLNKTSFMGKVVNVFFDSSATQCNIMYKKMTGEIPKEVPTTNEVHKSVKSHKYQEEHVKTQVPPPASNMDTETQSTVDLVTRTEMLLNEKPYFSSIVNKDLDNVPNSEAQSKINLVTDTEMLLNEKGANVKPAFSSIENKDLDNIPDSEDNNSINSDLFAPGLYDNQSDSDETNFDNEEELLLPLSNPPSPFLSKDIYNKCFQAAAEQQKIWKQKDKLEAEIFKTSIRNVIRETVYESLHSDTSESDDESMTGESSESNSSDDRMSLSSLSSHSEKIVENNSNNSIIPIQVPNYPPNGYYYSPAFKNLNKHKNKTFLVEFRKKCMIKIKKELKKKIESYLLEKMRFSIAFNAFDQWWEKIERQSKKTPKKVNELQGNRKDLEEMASRSDNECNSIAQASRVIYGERKQFERKLFDSDSIISSSESHVYCFSNEQKESSYSNMNSGYEFSWQNKSKNVCKSLTINNFDSIRVLTSPENETHMAIDYTPSSDVEGSFIMNKTNGKSIKRNYNCMPDQVSNWEINLNITNKCITSQPIVLGNKTKLSMKKLKTLAIRDVNEKLQSSDVTLYNRMFKKSWIRHPMTTVIPNEIPHQKENSEWKIHYTGCSRSEGYYKVDSTQKAKFNYHFGHSNAQLNCISELKQAEKSSNKILAHSYETRGNKRKLLCFGTTSHSDLLKFNRPQLCKKKLKFAKSAIHGWGLFTMEPIASGDMVIEYVGEIIRSVVADLREKQYEATGIGSTYLFRIDKDTIIDATKFGNLSRFINHSCKPNCCAKIIAIEGTKKIIIYSKKPIRKNEEITYDYKLPLEDTKILCQCGIHGCRKTLN